MPKILCANCKPHRHTADQHARTADGLPAACEAKVLATSLHGRFERTCDCLGFVGYALDNSYVVDKLARLADDLSHLADFAEDSTTVNRITYRRTRSAVTLRDLERAFDIVNRAFEREKGSR